MKVEMKSATFLHISPQRLFPVVPNTCLCSYSQTRKMKRANVCAQHVAQTDTMERWHVYHCCTFGGKVLRSTRNRSASDSILTKKEQQGKLYIWVHGRDHDVSPRCLAYCIHTQTSRGLHCVTIRSHLLMDTQKVGVNR